MKIAHVITRLLNAGSEENTIASCRAQAANGHEVFVLHGEDFNPEWHDSLPPAIQPILVPDMVHPIRPIRDFRATLALKRLYRDLGIDVVHTHQSKAGIVGRVAAAWARTPAVIHTVHIAPFLNVGTAIRAVYVAIEAACARITHKIINVSEGMRDACLAHGVGRPDQHVVIHSGMPIGRFQNASPPRDWRARIGGWAGPAKPRIALMLAAFEPRKRQEAWLSALAPHLHANRDVVALFAGAGERQEEARLLATTLGIQDQVRFMGHDPEPETLIALADVCVLTSEREGLPRVVVQYLAGGRPVVITRLPGIDEIVVDGRNGLIVDQDDLEGAAALTLDLLSDPDRLNRLSLGARATDVSAWAEERMGGAVEAVYQEVLAGKRSAEHSR